MASLPGLLADMTCCWVEGVLLIWELGHSDMCVWEGGGQEAIVCGIHKKHRVRGREISGTDWVCWGNREDRESLWAVYFDLNYFWKILYSYTYILTEIYMSVVCVCVFVCSGSEFLCFQMLIDSSIGYWIHCSCSYRWLWSTCLVCVLGIKLRFSVKAVHVLYCWVIALNPFVLIGYFIVHLFLFF